MSIKIQINSLKALERLIGGDNEIEIEIRNNIVQEFSKRYLKSIVSDRLILRVKEDLEADIIKSANEQFGEYSYYRRSFNFKPEFATKMEESILIPVREEFLASAGKLVAQVKDELLEELRPEFENYIKLNLDAAIQNQINVHIANKVDQIVTEVLGVTHTPQ
jgi:hypothetical protein